MPTLLPIGKPLTAVRERALFAGSPLLNLSAASFAANASIGTAVGALSVSRGIGSYTYSLTSNPGSLFAISGSTLQVNNASIAAGSYPVTIQANNGAGSIVTRSFLLVATASGVFLAVDMSDFRNTYILGL
ncbi:hypothetical protein ACQR1Y_12150 [Bradyrhizobium sp. HKCCYLRH3099]|uniref:hypothetical protein n=1 Tax=unclassified Bradyrhizobium TaxID=2631580 RepID=UPI003EBF5133